jgi:beta-N-acetylhexosaminidase
MHAITKHYGLEEAIKLAIVGGVDIMTFSNNIQGSDQRTVDKVHSIIKDMVKKGVIKEDRIDESFRRIMKLKNRLNHGNDVIQYRQALEKTNRELEDARRQVQQARDSISSVRVEVAPQEPASKKKKRKKKD